MSFVLSGAPAAQEGVLLAHYRLLVPAPVGTSVAVTFRNPGADQPSDVTLTAVADGQMSQYSPIESAVTLVEK